MATAPPSRRPRGPVHGRGSGPGFTLIEVLVVVAAVVLLAAAVTPRMLSWIDEGRSARAQGDAGAIAAAMNRFFQDTTRWPGQVEILRSGSDVRFLTVGDPESVVFPAIVGSVGISAATCVSGLSGVVANVTSFENATPSPDNTLNITPFLTVPPPVADYPNWHGPYLSRDLTADPWGSVFVINVIPLFCGETVTSVAPAGSLGFGWIISGGANRTLQTPFTQSRVTEDSDDVGVTLSKRMVQAP